ncbi:hypothetical protein X975_24403, partial [Stegodyphus mimosarum]
MILSALNLSRSSFVNVIVCHIKAPTASFRTFSWISCVDCASQKATVATSLSIGISTEQSLPSKRATNGRVCIGPFGMVGARAPMGVASIRGRLTGFFLSICADHVLTNGIVAALLKTSRIKLHTSLLFRANPAQCFFLKLE